MDEEIKLIINDKDIDMENLINILKYDSKIKEFDERLKIVESKCEEFESIYIPKSIEIMNGLRKLINQNNENIVLLANKIKEKELFDDEMHDMP